MVALALLGGFLVGFPLGILTYAHLYQHFKAGIEATMARRHALERQRETINRAIIEQTRMRLVEQHGPDLSRRHQEIIDEELAAVVTRPRNGEES